MTWPSESSPRGTSLARTTTTLLVRTLYAAQWGAKADQLTLRDAAICTVSFDIFDSNNPALNQNVDVQEDHYKLVREVAAAGTVLLKNVGDALPLRAPKTIAVIGMRMDKPRVDTL